jgi:hypothetical protein
LLLLSILRGGLKTLSKFKIPGNQGQGIYTQPTKVCGTYYAVDNGDRTCHQIDNSKAVTIVRSLGIGKALGLGNVVRSDQWRIKRLWTSRRSIAENCSHLVSFRV